LLHPLSETLFQRHGSFRRRPHGTAGATGAHDGEASRNFLKRRFETKDFWMGQFLVFARAPATRLID
jgi:hypothetical protein